MFYKKEGWAKKSAAALSVTLVAGIFTACGQPGETGGDGFSQAGRHESQVEISLDLEEGGAEAGERAKAEGADEAGKAEGQTGPEGTVERGDGNKGVHTGKTAQEEEAIKSKFGEGCIAGQAFEVELSEYDGKVWFVPYGPSQDGQDFYMQIIQDGTVLTDIKGYVPDRLAGLGFDSLDAVSFYDINYDNHTDIVLVATYGGTRFAAVYYGHCEDGEDYETCFMPQKQLSETLTAQVDPLSIFGIRDFLAGGKRNGKFAGWQDAYEAVSRLCQLEGTAEMEYGLIDFDGDDIPELVAGARGYYTSLYTYDKGRVYTLMDRWPYGAMGNAGYEYSPGKNSLRNYNSDYAGAVLYTTYMTVGKGHSMDAVVQVETYNFDDSNRNGILDEEEMGSFGKYGVNYVNGIEATEEECASYDVGGYEPLEPVMSFEKLKEELSLG